MKNLSNLSKDEARAAIAQDTAEFLKKNSITVVPSQTKKRK